MLLGEGWATHLLTRATLTTVNPPYDKSADLRYSIHTQMQGSISRLSWGGSLMACIEAVYSYATIYTLMLHTRKITLHPNMDAL